MSHLAVSHTIVLARPHRATALPPSYIHTDFSSSSNKSIVPLLIHCHLSLRADTAWTLQNSIQDNTPTRYQFYCLNIMTTEEPLANPDATADNKKVSINSLQDEHRIIFTRAISRVLATDIAEVTFAQIIDGLPLASVAEDTAGAMLPDRHPLQRTHSEFCPGVLERTQEFRTEFDAGFLQFDARVSGPVVILSI
jgi:hypothetical protein